VPADPRDATDARHLVEVAARVRTTLPVTMVPCGGCSRRRVPMSDEKTKSDLDHVHDTLSQLKEMRHYSKNNVELLTTQWLLFDGELSKLKKAGVIEGLMTRQGEFHDALESAITDLEDLAVQLQPAPEE
jgi:hypothetical protein